MSDDVRDYKGVRGSKKFCSQGYHAEWEVEKDSILMRGEVCVVCGKKVLYQKHGAGTSEMLDIATWRKNHLVDLLLPFYPDGSVNPKFEEFYGDPSQLGKNQSSQDPESSSDSGIIYQE